MLELLASTPRYVVCVKPVGVSAQDSGSESLPRMLAAQLDLDAVYPVHRLDQQVGGVMVYAKTAKAAADFSRYAAENGLKKTYLAVIRGCPEEPSGEWTDLLFHDRSRNKTYVVRRSRNGVKEARLAYRVLQQREEASLVQVQLFTGRTHQIRVQFSSRGFPLLGDGKYGSRDNRCTVALWSYRLEFEDEGMRHTFTAVPPAAYPWEQFSEYNGKSE